MSEISKLLIVDDDEGIRELLAKYLTEQGFQVSTVADGSSMKQILVSERFDLIILDVMLPDEDGFSLCAYCRQQSDVAIVMLTAKGEAVDKIKGLELGADDYLAKPFVPGELLARINSVLRRKQTTSVQERDSEVFQFAGWQFDINARHLLSPDGIVVALSQNEYKLLSLFVQKPQRVLTRDYLMQTLKHREQMPFDRAIDMQVSRLRIKLKSDANPDVIKTVRGEGYIFSVPVTRQGAQ